jgi:TENA/THI-4/PQQC family protein
MDARISKYDLLCHPFYKAWSAGQLVRNDLREYAQDYYHHVEAFPSYLTALGRRWDAGELRQAELASMCDKKAWKAVPGGTPFDTQSFGSTSPKACMGSARNLEWHTPVPEIRPRG